MPRRHLARLMSVCALTAAAMLGASGTSGAAPADAGLRYDNVAGTFGAPGSQASAFTYDTKLVPAGASARVVTFGHKLFGTSTMLAVTGLLPNREYGAHVHSKPCGATGDAAGPHFQNVPDPVQPSVDPKYANPKNEIWLDFTSSSQGFAIASSEVAWSVTDARAPKSVVIHEHHTHTGHGHAGEAGDRLACINVGF